MSQSKLKMITIFPDTSGIVTSTSLPRGCAIRSIAPPSTVPRIVRPVPNQENSFSNPMYTVAGAVAPHCGFTPQATGPPPRYQEKVVPEYWCTEIVMVHHIIMSLFVNGLQLICILAQNIIICESNVIHAHTLTLHVKYFLVGAWMLGRWDVLIVLNSHHIQQIYTSSTHHTRQIYAT